jgi:hypothetical protein
VTGQLDQGLTWFFLVLDSWFPNSRLHCMLLMQPPIITSKFQPIRSPSNIYKISW